MSTDLELRRDVLEVRLPRMNSGITGGRIQVENTAPADCSADEECSTPTSQEDRIPEVLTCPPPPRKQRPVASRKRKLRELQFFEIVARDEIDEFFRSSFELVKGDSKRRCPCN